VTKTRFEDDPWTVAAVGAVVPCLASIAHEALGHGLTCRAVGGKITLLTATHFACVHGSVLVDVLGPVANLVMAAGGLVLLHQRDRMRPMLSLFLFLTVGINLCWFAGEMLYSAVLNIADEANVARELAWPESWRMAAILLSILLYFATVRLCAAQVRRMIQAGEAPLALRRRLAMAHGVGIVTFAIAGLCWTKAPLASCWEAMLTVGIAAIPLWFGILPASRGAGQSSDSSQRLERSIPWIVTSAVVVTAFFLLQARGTVLL
jgi:hypothetical protein